MKGVVLLPRRMCLVLSVVLLLLGLGMGAGVFAPLVRAVAPPAETEISAGGDAAGPGETSLDPNQSGAADVTTGDEPGSSAGAPGVEPTGSTTPDPSVPPDASQGYYLRVDVSRQMTYAYLDGRLVRSMISSTGTSDKPTPTGRFYIQNRGEEFFSEKYQQGGRWWVSFKDWGVYLFHSVPIDRNGDYIPEEAEKLGQPASHGCVRLAVDDARWVYDTIPEGAPVDIE